ncbi:winged helix-turn-helix transcriptional regulator [Tenggerimyces flavus]|uniref:Winged helix-turn-helix transcriptional regulator n=1 Tax=Tenggerimyces flavus TaxID=1708749 RepID=A0ABV7YBL7_9ACTN|nr:helix-turn-helix domain-containing protein [Tenggerimyces flavus]MBM7787194.1 DNA-binding HxlR family transcriptional regulator [Tenggerimyces flavus]
MDRYGQFCPVAKATELLTERWTLLVLRELLAGSSQFNQLRRGVPRMSPTLLAKRLRMLEKAGIVVRRDGAYFLSEAGRELEPIVMALGRWGIRWVPQLGELDYDPHLLLWDMHRRVDVSRVPARRTVLEFAFSDAASAARWWIVLSRSGADLCDFDPGYGTAVVVTGSLRALVRVWRGDLAWSAAVRSGQLTLTGSESARRAFPHWFLLSDFAPVERPAPLVAAG